VTLRAVILGLLISVGIGACAFFHDGVIRGRHFVNDLLPIGIYGPLILMLLPANVLLRRIRKSWALNAREIAVILLMALVAGSAATRGLSTPVSSSTMLPKHYQRVRPGWKKAGVVEMLPERMLPDTEKNESVVLDGYVTGLGEGQKHISPLEVPWGSWVRMLLFWLPLLLTLACAALGLGVVIHRQWARHEQLPYPTAAFAHSLLPPEGGAAGSIFGSRYFRFGAILVGVIHLNNYLCRFWGSVLIPVQLRFDFSAIGELFPALGAGGGTSLLQPQILFAVLAIAYLVSSDVSFSMGTMPCVFSWIAGLLAGYGVVLGAGNHLSPNANSFMYLGGYLAIFLMVLYTGRHHYWGSLRAALFLRPRPPNGSGGGDAPAEAWPMRLFLVGIALFAIQLLVVGVEWPVAIYFTALALITYVVVSRVIAETGAFYVGSQIFPGGLLWGFMGAMAIGPQMMALVFCLSTVVFATPAWSPMPFAIQAYRVLDLTGERVSRGARWALVAVVLAVVVAVPSMIYWQYDRGAVATGDPWLMKLAQFPGENLAKMHDQLDAQGALETSLEARGVARLSLLRPDWPLVMAFAIIFGLTLLTAFLRLRFAWWPLHPVAFVFLHGHQGRMMAFSFLLGWAIKSCVTRYGGTELYKKVRPLMIGLIVGDLAGRFLPMLTGIIFYAITGERPS